MYTTHTLSAPLTLHGWLLLEADAIDRKSCGRDMHNVSNAPCAALLVANGLKQSGPMSAIGMHATVPVKICSEQIPQLAVTVWRPTLR